MSKIGTDESRAEFEAIYEIEKDKKHLVLRPYGDSWYVLGGIDFHSCGRARYGVSIMYYPNKAGGVLSLDEVVELRDFLNRHIEAVARLDGSTKTQETKEVLGTAA